MGLLSFTFFLQNLTVKEIMWKKYGRAGHATDDNMAHAHCKLDTKDYKHSQNMKYLLLFHCNDVCTKGPNVTI